MEEERRKRKTTTSSAVKRRYNAKVYKRFQADIKLELSERISSYSEKENLSKSEFLQRAIDALDH